MQRCPTWLVVLVSVLVLAAVALWVQEDVIINTTADLFKRETLKIFFDNAEAFAIVAAVILYFKGAPDRKAQKHYEAWRTIENAAVTQVATSYARFQALQVLHRDQMPLRFLEAVGANLAHIHLTNADLTEANLREADLRSAHLHHVNFSGATLRGANLENAKLKGANLRGADLRGANLRNVDLTEADLRNANLKGASLRGAELWKAQFMGANLENAELKWAELQGQELYGARLDHTVMPDGSIEQRTLEYWGDEML